MRFWNIRAFYLFPCWLALIICNHSNDPLLCCILAIEKEREKLNVMRVNICGEFVLMLIIWIHQVSCFEQNKRASQLISLVYPCPSVESTWNRSRRSISLPYYEVFLSKTQSIAWTSEDAFCDWRSRSPSRASQLSFFTVILTFYREC